MGAMSLVNVTSPAAGGACALGATLRSGGTASSKPATVRTRDTRSRGMLPPLPAAWMPQTAPVCYRPHVYTPNANPVQTFLFPVPPGAAQPQRGGPSGIRLSRFEIMKPDMKALLRALPLVSVRSGPHLHPARDEGFRV